MGTSGRCGRKPIRPKLNADMDKYRVLEEWGAGSFGVTCLVEELEKGRKYAVKKVECIDEQEANLVLEEAKSLLALQHPHICAYKEFFMLWDHKISSLFFCLVMDYCDHGNLEQMVRENRRHGKIIDEKIIQRFLGQAIDALIYVHKKSVTHRNLKPSNILMKREDFFVISDFLPQTLATDEMKMKIRVDPERKIFMAPESLELVYSDKSDIWSLGCILLDLMTTSMKTDAEMVELLEEVKLEPLSLQKSLEEIQDKVGYSEELSQLLPRMLKHHSEERPSAADLLREPYVIQCLALIGSSLSGLKKTLPPGVLDELKDGGIEKVIGFMKRYPDFEDAQLSALKHLTSYDSGRNGVLDIGDTIHLVSLAMRTLRDSYEVQWEGIRVLRSLLSQGDNGYRLASWILTPYLAPRTEAQESFNYAHKKTRSQIERVFGQLKSRFRCLDVTGGALLYHPILVGKIILACAVLHNIALLYKLPIEIATDLREQIDCTQFLDNESNQAGNHKRDHISLNYFGHRP